MHILISYVYNNCVKFHQYPFICLGGDHHALMSNMDRQGDFIFLASDFCRFCVVSRFFIPVTTANDIRLRRIFYPRFYPLHLFSYLNSWERASIFLFECSVLNKGTTGTICITSLVWRGPWLGIEPGTSSTRSQHYTTRLSRRRFYNEVRSNCNYPIPVLV